MKTIKELKNFLLLWIGQFFSTLGSQMTSFAITLWIFEKTSNVLSLSISSALIMLPRMIIGIFASPLIDRFDKKKLILFTDIGAGICTLIIFLLYRNNNLELWHIYLLNTISSIFGSFQTPASSVSVSLILPKKHYIRASALQSFSDGIVQILSPIFAATILGFAGMNMVFLFDLLSLSFACITLILFVKIPNYKYVNKGKKYIEELKEGFKIIKDSNLLSNLLLFMGFINFVSGITYYNLISPLILIRTNNNAEILAHVNMFIGLGGIVGGLIISVLPESKNKLKTLFLCGALSFVFGDILLSLGGSYYSWIFAGFFSSVFIPTIQANDSYFWRIVIPLDLQGRAFAFKYGIQSGMIPLGTLIGGFLAQYLFEPYMTSPNVFSKYFGTGAGSGISLMFFITGLLGLFIGILGFPSKSLNSEENKLI